MHVDVGGKESSVHVIHSLEKLYAAVERVTRRLDRVHSGRLQCRRGCISCCVDGITVFQVEADQIVRHHRELLESATPAPVGRCAFLDDEGACRIYEQRPYVCRTQGYPLRWVEESESGEDAWEMRDICPLNDQSTPIVELEAKDCWTLGPAESRLRRLQAEYSRIRNRENATGSSPSQGESGDADFGRTSLRSLFRSSGGGTR